VDSEPETESTENGDQTSAKDSGVDEAESAIEKVSETEQVKHTLENVKIKTEIIEQEPVEKLPVVDETESAIEKAAKDGPIENGESAPKNGPKDDEQETELNQSQLSLENISSDEDDFQDSLTGQKFE
jgi:hypothetical protein